MHVLRLTPHFYWPQLSDTGWPVPFDTIGGMQSQVFRLTSQLAAYNIRQTVLTLKVPGTPAVWQLNDKVTVRGVRVPILPFRSRIRGLMDLNISWVLGIAREILKRQIKCDIVHVHCSGVFWPLLLGILVAPALKARLVLTIHCSVLATYEPMHLLDNAMQPFARFIERKALRNAAHVFTLSERSCKVLLEQSNVKAGALSIVPDSIDVENFRSFAAPEKAAAFKRRFNLPDDRPIIVYVGRIAREKGWRRLLDLAEQLAHRQLHFLVCGDGNERDLIEQEIVRRSLTERFTVTGYLSQETVAAALACTSVLVLTSLHEEFGGVLLEAMAMKVPQVAFAVGGIPNVIADGKTGLLIPPHDTEAMAKAIEKLIVEPAWARAIGEAGLERVREHFGLDGACQKIINEYQRITS